jgi:opacity protein-like surface antigen
MIKSIRNLFIAASLMMLVSTVAYAQDEINQGEFYGGYMFQRVEGFNANGFTLAGTYNVNRFAGIKGEFAWGRVLGDSGVSFMGGVQVKDNGTEGGPVRPFAHVLLGVSRAVAGGATNNFSMAFGGGIDIKASDRVSVRAIQADYKPVFISGSTYSVFRLSTGLVIH